jgi:hypothetical protein
LGLPLPSTSSAQSGEQPGGSDGTK